MGDVDRPSGLIIPPRPDSLRDDPGGDPVANPVRVGGDLAKRGSRPSFIYGITSVFLVPLIPLFEDPSANGWVLEVSSLVAMLVYALAAWGVVRVMWVTLEEEPRHGGGPGAPA